MSCIQEQEYDKIVAPKDNEIIELQSHLSDASVPKGQDASITSKSVGKIAREPRRGRASPIDMYFLWRKPGYQI